MNLIKSTGTFSFFTIISRLLGYLRDILIAIILGTGFLADVFFVAFRIPNTFRRLFSEGTFNAAFVPSYTNEQRFGKKKSDIFANQVFNLLLIILLFLVILIEIFAPFFVSLLAPGFTGNEKKIYLAIELTRITFPFLLFVSLASFFAAILNSNNKFAAAAASPIILNIVLIITLLFSASIGDRLAYDLSYAVTVSGIMQLVFLYFFVKKYFTLKLSFDFKINQKIKFFFKKLLPSIFASGVTQINILIGTIIASFQAGAVSYLYYADRIYQINLAIAGIAIGVVMLPQLSKHISKKNKKKIDLIQNKALELSLFLSLPASIALLIGSKEIVSALFGYGQFDEESVVNSSNALYNLDDQADISNARDDSANKIQIAWSEDARIETKAISSYNATHVVVSSAFSSAPDQETIFAISQTTAEGDRLAGSPITYMISEVKENDDKTFFFRFCF